MVTMQMGEEDGLEMGEREMGTAQRHLYAFGTVEHEEFLADIDDLRGTETTRGGEGCTATKYMNVKFLHEWNDLEDRVHGLMFWGCR